MARLRLPRWRVGDKVKPTEEVLASEEDLAAVSAGKIGRVYKVCIDDGHPLPIIVIFGTDIEEWAFDEDELERVDE